MCYSISPKIFPKVLFLLSDNLDLQVTSNQCQDSLIMFSSDIFNSGQWQDYSAPPTSTQMSSANVSNESNQQNYYFKNDQMQSYISQNDYPDFQRIGYFPNEGTDQNSLIQNANQFRLSTFPNGFFPTYAPSDDMLLSPNSVGGSDPSTPDSPNSHSDPSSLLQYQFEELPNQVEGTTRNQSRGPSPSAQAVDTHTTWLQNETINHQSPSQSVNSVSAQFFQIYPNQLENDLDAEQWQNNDEQQTEDINLEIVLGDIDAPKASSEIGFDDGISHQLNHHSGGCYSVEPIPAPASSPLDGLNPSGNSSETNPMILEFFDPVVGATSQLENTKNEIFEEDAEDDFEKGITYPAGSAEQTKLLAKSDFMKRFRRYVDYLKTTSSPEITESPPPRSVSQVVKVAQPVRRQPRKDGSQTQIPDVILLDDKKVEMFNGMFCFGTEEWTLTFDQNQNFRKFLLQGKLRHMIEEILQHCLGNDLSFYTLTGSSYVQRELTPTHQPVQKISGIKQPVPDVLRWAIVSFIEAVLPDDVNLPLNVSVEKIVRSCISKICSRHNERKTKRTGISSKILPH